MHNVFVSLPSARGVHPDTVWNLFNMRTELEKVGDRLHGSSTWRMPLDLARNEGATVYLSTTCDINLLIDDDCQAQAEWLPKMVAALDAGCDIVSAPCRMRSEGNLFNIIPLTEPEEIGGLRVVECAWTGLGVVLVKRRVLEKLSADPDEEHYRSVLMPQRTSAAIFKSRVVPAQKFFVEAPADLSVYVLDDRVFSLKAIAAGFKIHAAIDVPTVHDGMTGCFSEELEKISRLQAQAARAARPGIVGVDGRPVGGR